MADSVIGALRVLLGVDTAAFSTGLDGASKTLDKFSKSISSGLNKAAAAGAVAFTSAAIGITAAVKASINSMDELSKLSQKIGIPVEKLSALKLAAELSDVSVEALGKSMGKLATAMVTAASGGAGPATSAFQALGISMQTLKSNDPSVVMEAVSKRFSEMQDGATKTALANAIFGQRIGRELIPLLNQGAEGLKKAREEAEAFGLVISTQTGRQAEEFNDNLKRLGTIPQGVANIISTTLLPKLVEITNGMVEWAKENKVVQNTADALLRVIAFLADNFVYLGKVIAAFIAVKLGLYFVQLAVVVYDFAKAAYAAGLASVLMSSGFRSLVVIVLTLAAGIAYATGNLDNFIAKVGELAGKVGAALPGVEGLSGKVSEGLKAIGLDLKGLGGNLDGLKVHGDGAAEAMKNLKPPPAFDPSSSANATKFSEELLKIQLKAREIRGDFDGLAPGFVAAATSLKLIKDTGEGFAGTVDALTPKMAQLNDALYKLAGANITAANLTPWQEFIKQQTLVDEAYKRNAISAETFTAASIKGMAKLTETYGQFASTAAGNFSEFFKTFGKGNKEMFAIGKAFAVSQAIINTYVGATKALAEGGPILGPILAASVVALGLAQVAKIVAEKPPAMALGGSFMVGGAGGVDSQMVPIMATPGEKVTVDQNKYGSGGGSNILTIEGIKPKDYYRGDVLRDLIDNINIAIGDGYKLKVV